MGNFGSTRNLVLAIVISVAIIGGWQLFYEVPRLESEQQAMQEQQQRQQVEQQDQAQVPPQEETVVIDGEAVTVEDSPRITIVSDRVHGTIRLVGARFDDITLRGYHLSVDQESPEVVLLAPEGSDLPYFVEPGWEAEGGSVELPDETTPWQADRLELVAGEPLTLTWTNPQDIRFERTITLDDEYMFTITQRVVNESDQPIALKQTTRIERQGLPHIDGYFVLHEGPIGVFDETLEEYSYDDLSDDGLITQTSLAGWLGFSDKYWLVASVPDQQARFTASYAYQRGQAPTYVVSYAESEAQQVLPLRQGGEPWAVTSRLYVGAKVVDLLDAYEEAYQIPLFDRAVDFGWFYFLTKPLHWLLTTLNAAIGNFGFAIMALTVIVRLFLYPLANKSFKSMSRMKKLGPQMQALRERYKEDKPKLQQEMMQMYKREKVNPAAGCLPLLLQIPVFFALYKVLLVSIEMRHAPFVLWIEDLTAMDPTSLFNLFGLIPWDPPAFLTIGVLPLIMGAGMWAQQQLNPAPPDPIQAKIFGLLPIVFTFFLATFPAGLVLYWATNNLLSLLQQYVIMRRMGAPIGRKAGEAERKRLEAEAKEAIEHAQREKEERRQREKEERAAARAAAPAPTKPFKPKKGRGGQRRSGGRARQGS